MPAYAEMADKSWRETALSCVAASVGDAGLTLVIYALGALVKRNSHWIMAGDWKNYVIAALIAASCAAIIELVALSIGQWTYMDQMPLLPVLRIGLVPVLQLTLLVPLTFRIAVSRFLSEHGHDRH